MSMPTISLISPSKKTLISHDPPEESFVVLKLGNKSFTPNNDDIELDVFGAEKYFNNEPVLIPKNLVPTRQYHRRRPKKDELALEIFAIKPPTQLPTQQSVRSESSCNSRSSLLQPVTTSSIQQQQQQKQPSKKTNNKKLGFLARIGCKCSCAVGDESKTDVDGGGTHFAKRPATKSSSLQEKKKVAMMMSTWDAVISPEEEENIKTIPSICGGGGGDSGGEESDASSDLFEIESLSRGMCYAPSEVSVEWSVVTASAAADLEEPAGSGRKEMPRLRTLRSGCMSQKAVRVGGGGGQRNLRTESFNSQQRSGNAAHLLHA